MSVAGRSSRQRGSRAAFLFGGALCVVAMSGAFVEALAMMPAAVYRIGAPAAAGDVSVTLVSVTVRPAAAPSGDLQIEVACTMRNISKTALPLVRLPQLHLESKDGTVFDATGTPGAGPETLPIGSALRREALFVVPRVEFNMKTWLLRVGGPQGPRITLQ